MKLAVLCLCVLHVTFADAGIFARNEPQATNRNLSANRERATQSAAGTSNHGRQRPLFARRGQYERQSVPKPGVVHVSPNVLPRPRKVAPKPVMPTCSQPAQTCLPQSGCCGPHNMCHCRFFNAICFCRRKNSQYEKKT
ncbi:agouti-signaling protein-like isoform X1 [Scophthalmus maximus]|uniref:Agouti domain-containing protein n=1 Tax=Scophthalmus maximus TaxID=52904 RepID=A0A8D3BSU9_SCOMX|nr:agouti-signaling protein-like isoform X1 [Scophthalmus maximus]